MKLLVLLLLTSFAQATTITGGRILIDVAGIHDLSFEAPGYSFTHVLGDDAAPDWWGYCSHVCSLAEVQTFPILFLTNPMTGVLNGEAVQMWQGGNQDTQFISTIGSFANGVYTGQARVTGGFQPCFPIGPNCGNDGYGPLLLFNPNQRWKYTAHFLQFSPGPEFDDLYSFQDLTMAPVPEPGTFALIGLGSLFIARLRRLR